MKGGLLQLATVGKEDSVLINNPEIFHFKKVYKKHTNFSIDSNQMVLGEKKLDTRFEINLRKDGDLLKDLLFYVEIPYFEILKKIETTNTEFNRTESDKVYYKYLNMKSLVFFTGNDNFYIIPENVLYLNNNVKMNELDTLNIISINSKEYSKYFNKGSKINEIVIEDSSLHQSIPYLKTIDSFWFNNLINNLEEKENDKFTVSLVDLKKFSSWFNESMENRLFLNYQNLFNINKLKNKYQINFQNERHINEIKKLFEIKNRFDTITEDNYLDEELDIDKAIINNFKTKNFDFNYDIMEEYILQTIKYPSRFIKFILTKLYDSNIDNFFTFYNMFKVGYTVNNDIIGKNSNNYDNNIWDNYISNKFKSNFDNISSNIFTSGFFGSFIESSNYIEKKIDNLWTTLNLNVSNLKIMFSILHTFIDRYENFNLYENINFLDFFESTTDNNFFYRLKQSLINYSDINETNLETIYTNYGSKFDLTLIYNYIVYNLAYKINEFKVFEQFTNISKQNIQFIYWLRNKISNSIFLRYKRIQNNVSSDGSNFYPNFDNIREENELINIFYTFIPNNIISLNEIKKEIYRVFNSYSYLGNITNDSNLSTSYKTLSYVTSISNQEYDKNLNGTIDFQYKINVSVSDFTQSNLIISFNSFNNKIRKSFFDDRFSLKIIYQNNYYDVESIYSNGQTSLKLNSNLTLSDSFDLLVTLYMPICKYYFDYTPLTIDKNEFTFDSDNRTFYIDKYIETNDFTFQLESEPEEVISYLDLLTESSTTEGNEHSFVLNDNYYFDNNLLTEDNITNYTIKIYQLTNYTNNVTTTNFELNQESINDVQKSILKINTDDFFTLNSSNLYDIQYNSSKYRITLTLVSGSTTEYVISGDLPSDIFTASSTSYYITEYSSVVNSVSLFTLTGTSIESSEITNVNISTSNKTFEYSGSTVLDSDYNLIYQNDRYYQVNISKATGNTYQINNTDFTIENEFSIVTGYRLTFTDSTNLSTAIDYYLSFTLNSANNTTSQSVFIRPVLSNGTNFIADSQKFKYELESLENTTYTNLITNDSLTFTIKGNNNFINNYQLFSKYQNSDSSQDFITLNKINGNIFNFEFLENKTYFLIITYVNSNVEKRKIVIDEKTSLNQIKLQQINSNKYFIDEKIDFSDILDITIQSVNNFYKDIEFNASVTIDTDRHYYLNIPISSSDTVNYENYYKYVNGTTSSYYLIYNSTLINLGLPSVSSEVLKFKILNPENNFTSESSSTTYNIRVFVNDYLPNLVNFTSFYLLDSTEKCYDLMDYFIQTPMIIFTDNNSTKNSNIILYNFPVDTNNCDVINYLKFDEQYLHLRESINSNQMLRFDSNLISSVFDFNIIGFLNTKEGGRYYEKELLITEIESSLLNILETEDIASVVDLMENTNNLVIELLQTYGIGSINDGLYGKTIKQLVNTFNQLNVSNLLNEDESLSSINDSEQIIDNNLKYDVLSDFNFNDFNLYSKMVIDFFSSDELNKVSYDNQLGLSISSTSGKNLFITNYKPLLLGKRLNDDMLVYLTNYKDEIEKQLTYVNNNLSWLKLGNEESNNNFGYFYDFQEYFRDYLYDSNSYNYEYSYINKNSFDKYSELQQTSIINEKTITNQDNTITCQDILKPVNDIIISSIKKNNNSNYNYEKNKFNYVGPAIIYNGELKKDTINLTLEDNTNYMFVNDCNNCYLAENLSEYNFEINDKNNKLLIKSKLKKINDDNVDLDVSDVNMFIYELNVDNLTDISDNNYLLINNQLSKVFTLNFNNTDNIGIYSFQSIDFTYPNFYVGTLKSDSYLENTNNLILQNNMVNLIDFSNNEIEFKKVTNIIKLNKLVSNYNSSKEYCSLKDGILKFYHINNQYFTFILDNQIYELGNTILENKPIILKNKKITYHNISKTLTKDTYVYNENIISKLGDLSNSTNPENIWFLDGNIEDILIKFNYEVDLINNEIYTSEEIFNMNKESFLFLNQQFYKVSDFSLNETSNNYNSDEIIYYLDNNPYNNFNSFDLIPGRTYRFNTSNENNRNNQFNFSSVSDGSHNSGTIYSNGVTINGDLGKPNSYIEIQLQNLEGTLYYFSESNSGMGGKLSINRGETEVEVKVSQLNGNNIFYLDNEVNIELEAGKKYYFNTSNETNSSHPFRFSTTENGTHNGGTEYTTDVTYNGTIGTEGSYVEIIAPFDLSEIYFYCSNHSNMGNKITINNSTINVEVDVALKPNNFLVNQNSFSGQNDFYCITLLNNDSLNYNPLKNNTDTTLTNNNYFDISNVQHYLVNNNGKYNYNINLLFNNAIRPIEIQLCDSDNEINKLKYKLFSDSLFANEIDSIYNISENQISTTNTLVTEKNFYLQFDVSDSTVISQENGFNKYFLNKEKVSYVKISPINNNITVETLDISSTQFKFTISSGTELYKKNFYKYDFNVTFIYDSVEYNFRLVVRVVIDDNYTLVLEESYDTDSYSRLQEPYVINDLTTSKNKLKDVNDVTFQGSIPNLFKTTDNITLLINNSITFNNVKSYDKYVDYMQVDEQTDEIYQEIKLSNVSNINDKINYYDMLGKISIKENKIIIDDSYSKIIDLVQNLIIIVNDKSYYVNIESKVDETIIIDYNFETEISEGIVYFNLADAKYVSRKISINQELGIILTEFGGLRVGEIIEINNVVLLITNYDQQYRGYTFNIISNHVIYNINTSYESYFSIGMINNLNKKYSMVNLKQKNLLISKKNENIINGDLVINNKNITFYDSNISNLNEDTINYCFNHDGFDIFFYKLNNEWYFFGNNLGNNFKVVATYNNNQTKILEIKYIFKNKIIWGEDYTSILDSLSIYVNNKYQFYYPYQPFEIKYLEFNNNCSTNFSGSGVVEINNNYYLINNGSVTNFNKNILSGYYQIIPFEYTDSEFSNYDVKIHPFQKVNFDNINFYHSEDIYYNGVNYLKENLVDSSFNVDLEFYYFDGTNYQYPLYLKQTSYSQSSISINNIKFYYTSLIESSSEPSSSLNLTNWNSYYNLIFYTIKDGKYFYPLYLDLDKVSTSSENNTTKNIELTCNIIEKKPIINITSNPIITSYIGESYYYQITTNPSNCEITTENLPFWLTLNGSVGNYSISGIPRAEDKTDNDIILIAKYDESSSVQHFEINIADDSTSFNFTTNPKTFINVGEEYIYDISASPNLQSINVISKPTWLTFSNNTLSGYPLFDHVGDNIIIIEAEDTNNDTIKQKYNILVNLSYSPYISSNPITNIGHSETYTYNIEINNNNNENVTLNAKYLPTWLNLVGNTISGTSPSENEKHDVIIEVFKNELKSIQSFKVSVSDVSNIKFTSNPVTYCFNHNEYKYQITTDNDDNISEIEFVRKPDWITIDEHNIIRGTPNNCFLKHNRVEIKITDKEGFSIIQNYNIYVFDNQDKIIKINDGIYENIIHDLNLDYFTTVLINSSYYDINKIVNFKNGCEIFVNKYIDLSGSCKIIFPLNINIKKKEFINEHNVNITNEIINYTYNTNLSSTNSSIFCYYYNDNSEQLQVRIFNILLYPDLAFDIIDEDFVNFYNEKNLIASIYLENYFEIIITNINDIKYNFKILPFEIRYGSKILIEEKRNDKQFIYYLKLVLENGILKLEEDISNDESLFFINKIIPIKIIDKTIQLVNPIIKQNNYYGVNSREFVENWMAIPIKIIEKPVMVDKSWKLEIESKYLNLLSRYEIYNNLKNNNSFYKIEFLNENEKNYLIYSKLPEINNKVVYIKKIDYFSSLNKIYSNYKSNLVANDKNLEILLTNQWKLSSEKIIIPMTIGDGNRINEYTINSGFEEENINLDDSDINYYLDNDSNKILISGVDKNDQLQLTTTNEITNTDVEMYIEKFRNKIITDDSNELSSSVNTIFDVFLKNNIDNSFRFNTSKSILNWTSISFYDNKNYNNMKMIFNKNFTADSSGNVTLENNSNDSLFLYEEVQSTSSLFNKISLLSINDFENYEVLVELRKIENIIYKFIKENSSKIYFWDNPIDKINQYLLKYNGDTEVNKYLITKNCLVKSDEDTNDESKFQIINQNLNRLAYLDNQFDIVKNEDNIKVYRSQTKIKKVINDIISNIDNYYSGVDSHLVFQKISEISINKKTFFDYIIEGESFNFTYHVLTLEKLLISKQWENSKNNNLELYNLFNKEFNDSLTLTYDNIDSEILTGSLESSLDNLKFGIESYNKIINYNSNQENILLESYKISSDNYNDKEQLEYKIVSDNFFNYQIISSSDILFDPELEYYIDILEGNNVLFSEKLQVDKTYPNKLNFSSNVSYQEYNDISLLIKKDYSINNSTFNGYLYQNVFVNDLSSGDVFVKFNSNYLDIDSYEVDSSGIYLNILSTIKILNEDFLKIEKRISFKNQETKVIDNETRKYLTFSKNFYNSNFSNIQTDIYLDYNNDSFKIYKDSSGFFYITQSVDFDLVKDYNVFFYVNESFESRVTSQLIYNLELNEDLKNISYKNLDPLPSNFKVDNVNINDFKIINENLIQISMNEELNEPSNLNSEFRLDRKSPILVETIENAENPYLFQIKNYTYIFDDATIYLSDGTNDISGELLEYLDEDKNFLFRTSQYYNIFDLKEYYTIIENIVDISNYDFSDNYLSFDLDNEMTILTNENFEYYIDISGSYYLLTNENIYISDTILTIYDESFSDFTFEDSFNFKQINKEIKEISSSDYNQLLDLSLNNNYNPMEKNKYINLQYLSNNNEEIGNYIYYFYDANLVTDLNLVYKLQVESTIIDIFFIGKDNNNIYFSTVDRLDLDNKLYKFYSTDYSVTENVNSSHIFFKCNCYSWGQINTTLQSNESNKEFTVGIEISEKQELIVFPNTLNANLYFIPFNTNKSNLDLEIMLKNNYYFPDELDYKRFFNTSVVVEESQEEILWDKKTLKKVFKKIEFFMNDQKIDSLNEKILEIIEMYNDKQKNINNIPQLNNGFYYLYIPLPFWFVNSSFNYLPLIALQNTNLSLKIQLNSLSELIKNDLSFVVSKLPDKININLLSDTILLGDKERKQFAEYNHEYLIERNISYSDVFINQINKTITLPIKGLLKEIYWLFSSRDTGEYYLSNKIVDRDSYYDDYVTTKEVYLKYLENNREYVDEISIDYKEKFNIFDSINNIIEERTDSIYNIMVNNSILKKYNTEFLLYLYHYYLSYYDNYSDSYFETDIDNNRIQMKLNKLFLYLSNNYKDSFITKKESPVKSIDFKVNGRGLQAEIDSKYFNNVVPYEKLKRYIDLGIYVYSFSLHPTYNQPSGQLNFNILKNPTIELEMNQLVENENVILNTIVREYQILRIIGGITSLSWI